MTRREATAKKKAGKTEAGRRKGGGRKKVAKKKTVRKTAKKAAKKAAKRGLTALRERFCEEYARAAVSAAEAYRRASPRNVTDRTAVVEGSRLLTFPDVRARIAEIQEEAKQMALMDKGAKLAFLEAVMRTAPGEIDKHSALCQKYKDESEEVLGKDGESAGVRSKREVWICDKLKALAEHNRMTGDLEPEQREVSLPQLRLADMVRQPEGVLD